MKQFLKNEKKFKQSKQDKEKKRKGGKKWKDLWGFAILGMRYIRKDNSGGVNKVGNM